MSSRCNFTRCNSSIKRNNPYLYSKAPPSFKGLDPLSEVILPHDPFQVRLCLDKKDFIRAQILSRKVSPKAFVERKGEAKGDIGIEGTAIEAPEEVRACLGRRRCIFFLLVSLATCERGSVVFVSAQSLRV